MRLVVNALSLEYVLILLDESALADHRLQKLVLPLVEVVTAVFATFVMIIYVLLIGTSFQVFFIVHIAAVFFFELFLLRIQFIVF